MIAPISPAPVAQAPEASDLRQAAVAFEALFLQQMLREALPQQDGSGSLGLQALAAQLARESPFGIARLLDGSARTTGEAPGEVQPAPAGKKQPQP